MLNQKNRREREEQRSNHTEHRFLYEKLQEFLEKNHGEGQLHLHVIFHQLFLITIRPSLQQ